MTILKDELKIRPDEEVVAYAERVESVLERHLQETGERIHPLAEMPGERPGETLERMKKLGEADKIRAAERARTQSESAKPKATSASDKVGSEAAENSRRSYRLKSQERDIQRAGDAFEEARKKLFRMNGTKLYSEEEHAERLTRLREEFAGKVEKVVSEAETDAEGYEKEARAYSYTDPASQVLASERGKLETSRAFVKEDCEDMRVSELMERISAVSAGSDKAAKVLHSARSRTCSSGATVQARERLPVAEARLARLEIDLTDLVSGGSRPARVEPEGGQRRLLKHKEREPVRPRTWVRARCRCSGRPSKSSRRILG